MASKTSSTVPRRVLRFSSLADVLRDVEQIAAQPTRQLGNWSLGKICDHLARTIEISLDGPPLAAPWYVRLVAPWFKRRLLEGAMPPGFRLPPKIAARIVAEGDIPQEQGVARLRHALQRAIDEPQRTVNGVLGPLTRAESDQLQLRHAELHLSFIVPENQSPNSVS